MSDIKLCPSCNIRLRIGRAYQSTEDDKTYDVRELTCLHKRCPNYQTVVDVEKTDALNTAITP